MNITYPVEIRTCTGLIFKGLVEMLTLPGYEGEFCVLAHHEPMIAGLKEGTLVLLKPGEVEVRFPIRHGVCRVLEDTVMLFVEKKEVKESNL